MLSESNSLTQKDGNLKRKLDALDHGGATKKAKADKKAPTPVKELTLDDLSCQDDELDGLVTSENHFAASDPFLQHLAPDAFTFMLDEVPSKLSQRQQFLSSLLKCHKLQLTSAVDTYREKQAALIKKQHQMMQLEEKRAKAKALKPDITKSLGLLPKKESLATPSMQDRIASQVLNQIGAIGQMSQYSRSHEPSLYATPLTSSAQSRGSGASYAPSNALPYSSAPSSSNAALYASGLPNPFHQPQPQPQQSFPQSQAHYQQYYQHYQQYYQQYMQGAPQQASQHQPQHPQQHPQPQLAQHSSQQPHPSQQHMPQKVGNVQAPPTLPNAPLPNNTNTHNSGQPTTSVNTSSVVKSSIPSLSNPYASQAFYGYSFPGAPAMYSQQQQHAQSQQQQHAQSQQQQHAQPQQQQQDQHALKQQPLPNLPGPQAEPQVQTHLTSYFQVQGQ